MSSHPNRRSRERKSKSPPSTVNPGRSDPEPVEQEGEGSSSISSSQITRLKEETIANYAYFHFRVQCLVEKLKNLDSPEQVILMFTGDEIPHTDQSWCKDCNYLEGILSSFMRRAKHLAGYLVRVKVGSHDEWRDPSNPYRTDPKIRLKAIPTLLVWNSGKRLSGSPIFQVFFQGCWVFSLDQRVNYILITASWGAI
jgi:hypothetical protein